ncbi:MAG: tetratricopeptide repeat protein [Planctomycetota bacterium]
MLEWLGGIVKHADATNVGLLFSIQELLNEHASKTVSLREAAANVSGRLVDALGHSHEETGDLIAKRLLSVATNSFAIRLSDLGRSEEALSAADETVRLARELVASDRDAFTPDLASSLNNLANGLSDVGRREEALKAAEEAVGLRRTLAAARPDAFTPDLASSLNNLANGLSGVGRREEALKAAEEAVGLRRTLAAARPDAFTPSLALSLGAKSQVLVALERPGEAAADVHEGMQCLLPLARGNTAAFASLLAALCRHYLQAAEAAGTEPHVALLAEAAKLLGYEGDD